MKKKVGGISACLIALGIVVLAIQQWSGMSAPPVTLSVPSPIARPSDVGAVVPTSEPVIVVQVMMIEVATTSRDTPRIIDQFETEFKQAIETYNSSPEPLEKTFADCDAMASLIKDFASRAKVTVYDEVPAAIKDGSSQDWGQSISISASPTIEDDHIRLAVYAQHASGRLSTTVQLDSGRAVYIGGGGTRCETSTTSYPIPGLSQIPTIGPWLTPRITRTTGLMKYFVATARIQ